MALIKEYEIVKYGYSIVWSLAPKHRNPLSSNSVLCDTMMYVFLPELKQVDPASDKLVKVEIFNEKEPNTIEIEYVTKSRYHAHVININGVPQWHPLYGETESLLLKYRKFWVRFTLLEFKSIYHKEPELFTKVV